MAQSDEDGHQRKQPAERNSVQPAERILIQADIVSRRKGRQVQAAQPDGVAAPAEQDHHHHGGDSHDLQGLVARFRDALDVLPPEIEGDADGEHGCSGVHTPDERQMRQREQIVQQAHQILPRGDNADRPGQNVIEQQCGD